MYIFSQFWYLVLWTYNENDKENAFISAPRINMPKQHDSNDFKAAIKAVSQS
jgi:hypothetical protein